MALVGGGSLENLWRGEGKVQKKNIRAREWLKGKKSSYKEFDNDNKIPAARKFPSLPP